MNLTISIVLNAHGTISSCFLIPTRAKLLDAFADSSALQESGAVALDESKNAVASALLGRLAAAATTAAATAAAAARSLGHSRVIGDNATRNCRLYGTDALFRQGDDGRVFFWLRKEGIEN